MKAEEARTLALKARAPVDAEYLSHEFKNVFSRVLEDIATRARSGHSCALVIVEPRFYTLLYPALRQLGYVVVPMIQGVMVTWE